ncbi:MAG TPA: 16S rRNA (guanine(527)-N(7))-methyltransferase RsmG [Methylomirabilota bacterium]|nr:16S rRNA (guanine(527)-N(7))-methyltransferase RsmG [Methylomirabilota bacterium]
MTPEAFAAAVDVSRETLDGLRRYADLLVKWQRSINLVAADSLDDLWRRHMLDSAQLYRLLPPGDCRVVDLGSGAGFPGLVLAAIGAGDVHLVESDGRKCVFLAEAARACGLEAGVNPVIHRARLEQMRGLTAEVVTARACAPLDRLLDYAEPFLRPQSICLFLKGAGAADELTAAANRWRMTVERLPSVSDPSGTILRIGQVTRAGR